MKKEKLLLIIAFLISIKTLLSQNFQLLNNLPPTIEVQTPEFKTQKKYYFKVDSKTNNLVIQDLRSSINGKVHFYQWVYEIPISTLSNTSFEIKEDFMNEDEVQLVISSKNNSIISYMFQDGKVITINSMNKVPLGNWSNSKETLKLLNNSVEIILNDLPISKNNGSYISKNNQGTFKYIRNNVQAINAKMDEDLTIGNGYYLGEIKNINSTVIKKIKNALKTQKISYNIPLPIIIYADKIGNIESVFINNQPYEKYCKLELSNFKPIKLTKNVPTKYIFLIN